MAFLKSGLKAMGGEGFPDDEGKMFCYTSPTDTLQAMQASGYFNSISNTLDSVYLILCRGTNGELLMTFNRDSTGLILTHDNGIESFTGAGALNVTDPTTDVTSTGADALTLANGVAVGQRKTVNLIVDGGTATLIPATRLGYASIAFADAGDSATLEWRTGGWIVIATGGLAGGPVVA